MTNLHISLEAVEWRLVQVTFVEMCIFEFSNISTKYNITYIIYLNFVYLSYSLMGYVII